MFSFVFRMLGLQPSGESVDELEQKSQELLQSAQEQLASAMDGLSEYRSSIRADIEELAVANPIVGKMIQSFEFALAGLQHPDWLIRYSALAVTNTYHESEKQPILVSIFEKMAFTDPNVDVRGAAILSLSSIVAFQSPKQKRQFGRRLAKVAFDNKEDVETRKFAYRALCRLNKDDLDRFAKSFDEEVMFPNNIDWDYIRSWI